ncbi:hexokinase type 2-like [Littorina saxatilis]|uniref:hexokinase type 2-like n=1 Tax=Littorina saxatilis TaxID=31220 RepID=UPI0038B5B7DD
MNKRPTDKDQADSDANDPLLPPKNHITPNGPTSVQDKQSDNIILKGFQLSKPDLERICKHLTRELDASSTAHCKTRIKRSTRVQPLPKGNEKGDFLSLSIGSDGVDIRRVILSGSNTDCLSEMYDLPKVTATGEENTDEPDLISFFFGVAGCAKMFLKSQNLTTEALHVEYVSRSQFGPDDDVTMERVKECTEGIVSEDDMDKDATELQQHALRKMNATHRLRIKPTVKDPVGTLLSGIYHDQACTVAFLPDVQLTACYVPKHNTDKKAATITTIEWGEVADTGCLEIFRADIDRELNESSENHEEKFLEKMVSCKHIGEILRLALLKLHKDGAVFMSVPSLSALQRNGTITFKHVSLIESDLDGQNGLTRVVLNELKMEKYTSEDCNIVRNICKTIIERSAHLTAAALVALITHVKQSEVIIAVDGSMYRDHAEFYKIMEDKTKELLNGNHKFKLLPQYNGRRIGAAVASVLAPKEDSNGRKA